MYDENMEAKIEEYEKRITKQMEARIEGIERRCKESYQNGDQSI